MLCMMTSQYSTGTVIDTSDGYAFGIRGRVKGEPAAAQPHGTPAEHNNQSR